MLDDVKKIDFDKCSDDEILSKIQSLKSELNLQDNHFLKGLITES